MKKILLLLVVCMAFNAAAAKKHKEKPPELPTSIMLVNQSTHTVLVNENTDAVRSVASITKLMTAMVFLDQSPNLEAKLPRSKRTVKDLFTLMLVRSDNGAAEVLSRMHPGGQSGFVAAMNRKADLLGMTTTTFADPTGLLPANTSTAVDIVKLVIAAGAYPDIRHVSSLKETNIKSGANRNTNYRLLFEFDNIVISKTGFINKAGRCLTLLVEKSGQQFAVVILGEATVPAREARARQLLRTHLNEGHL